MTDKLRAVGSPSFNNYEDYLRRRCDELDFEGATAAVRARLGIYKEEQMPWGENPVLADQYAQEFKKAQCPIFVQVASELYHTQGHKDVGLGSKPGGNNWTLTDGRQVASDIIVLKEGNQFQWVDCFSSMGGPQAKPQWAVIEPNTDRTWTEPPPLSGDSGGSGDGGTGGGDGGGDATQAAQIAELQRQVAQLQQQMAGALQVGDKLYFRMASGQVLCAKDGGPSEPNVRVVFESRDNRGGSWEDFEVFKS